MSGEGYEVDTGDLQSQANRDWNDAYELNGAASDLYSCDGPAAAGAADSTELLSAAEYAFDLFRNVFWEFSDATSILGSSEHSAVQGYDTSESTSSSVYARMRAF